MEHHQHLNAAFLQSFCFNPHTFRRNCRPVGLRPVATQLLAECVFKCSDIDNKNDVLLHLFRKRYCSTPFNVELDGTADGFMVFLQFADAIGMKEQRGTAREKIKLFLHDFRLPLLRKFIFYLLVLLSLRVTGVTLFGFVLLTVSLRITQE